MEKTKHAHAVADQDLPFVIDPITKEVQPQGLNRVVPQHAKNSERFTFTIPDRYIEGHDMSEVNQAFVHFRNVGTQGQLSAGIYKVEDFAVADDSVTLSWLIDDDATYYVGALIFSIHFICTDESGEVVYDLPTLAYSKISVGETVWNSEEITKKYPDIIAQLEARISAIEAGGVPGGTVTPIAYLYNGVELPALPDWDEEAYPYAYIRKGLGISAGTSFYVSPMPWRYYNEEGSLADGFGYVDLPDGESISYYSSTLKEGQWGDFQRLLMSNISGVSDIIWSNKPIYNKADGTLYMNGSDPVPVYPEGGGGVTDAVLYTEQTLTEEQQAQARENIGVEAKTIDLTGYGIVLGTIVAQSITGNRLFSDTGELWEEINCGRELEFKVFDGTETLTETLIVFPSSQASKNGEIVNVSFSVQLILGSGMIIGSVSLTKSSPEDSGGTVSTLVSWVTNIIELPEPEEM